MKRLQARYLELVLSAVGVAIAISPPGSLTAQAPAAGSARFDSYVKSVEVRLAEQHRSRAAFLATPATRWSEGAPSIPAGRVQIEHIIVPGGAEVEGAMIHHWRASTFVRGASAADFEALLRNLPAYPRIFAPRVTRADLVAGRGDRVETAMRLREQHVITIWMDASYDVQFGQLDPTHRYMISRSTQVRELAGVGTPSERTLSPSEEHGWLWRMNTYWSYQEKDGGLYLQVESISLSRAIPRGLGWAVGPYVESVPRQSLEWTLQAVCRAIQK